MSPPRVRFTVWRPMVAVAIASGVLLIDDFIANEHVPDAPWVNVAASVVVVNLIVGAAAYLTYRWWRAARQAFISWQAAHHPWLPVVPDPPGPE